MVWDQLYQGVAQGIGQVFSGLGIGGRSGDAPDDGKNCSGNLFSNFLAVLMDDANKAKDQECSLTESVKDTVHGLTTKGINALMGPLQIFWNDHKGKEDAAAVRQELDALKDYLRSSKMQNEPMAGKLANVIQCVEDEDCPGSSTNNAMVTASSAISSMVNNFFCRKLSHK